MMEGDAPKFPDSAPHLTPSELIYIGTATKTESNDGRVSRPGMR